MSAGRILLYHYGPSAWFWRALMLPAIALGAYLATFSLRGEWVGLAVGLPLLLPAVFFGAVVATRVERHGDWLHLRMLLWPRRRVRIDRLGVPIRRRTAQATVSHIWAPRLWQPVRGRLPFYLDLLAQIPDRRAFEAVFGALPQR
jgi:hypothetical protein